LQIVSGYLDGPRQKIQTVEKEIIMKSFLLFIALICAVTLSSSSTASVTNAANAAKKERAVMTFNQPVKLMGVMLKPGEYLFVHDNEAMARGEACTFVYRGDAEIPNKLVISFHCTPAERAKVGGFTVRTLLTSPGQYEISEFQFGGSTEAHLVPVAVS
jgi:hypothetical protein